MLIERSVEHPLLPFRILANRTRAASFVVMMLVPGRDVRDVLLPLASSCRTSWATRPLQTGFAFLPFSVGIVVAATIALEADRAGSTRASSPASARCSPAPRCSGSPGCPYDDSPARSCHGVDRAHVNYWTDLLPFIVMMSLGMGLTFVPLTLTAVHGVRRAGLAASAPACSTRCSRSAARSAWPPCPRWPCTSRRQGPSLSRRPSPRPAAPRDPEKAQQLQTLIGQVAFTEGATHAFLTGA